MIEVYQPMDTFLRWLKSYFKTSSSFVSFLRMTFLNTWKKTRLVTVCIYFVKTNICDTYLIFPQFLQSCYPLFNPSFLKLVLFHRKSYPFIVLRNQVKVSFPPQTPCPEGANYLIFSNLAVKYSETTYPMLASIYVWLYI